MYLLTTSLQPSGYSQIHNWWHLEVVGYTTYIRSVVILFEHSHVLYEDNRGIVEWLPKNQEFWENTFLLKEISC